MGEQKNYLSWVSTQYILTTVIEGVEGIAPNAVVCVCSVSVRSTDRFWTCVCWNIFFPQCSVEGVSGIAADAVPVW